MTDFSLLFDSIFALIAYACALLATLAWVHRSGQTRVPATAETTRMVAKRLAVVVVAALAACYVADVALWIPVVVVLSLLLLAGAGSILGLPGVVVAYGLQQIVLGFPVVRELVLEPPEPIQSDNQVSSGLGQYIGRTARTVSTLRPVGEIELDDARMTCASASGKYIERGTDVVITGVKNGSLVVREIGD